MIAIDSGVIVAATLSWHEKHGAAVRALERAMNTREGIVVPSHVVLESYSVLTRLPPPHRLAPAAALRLLQENFGDIKLAAHPARNVFPLINGLAEAGLGGGIVYDALILDCAVDAGATTLLTLNARDYERLPVRLKITSIA